MLVGMIMIGKPGLLHSDEKRLNKGCTTKYNLQYREHSQEMSVCSLSV